MNQNFDVIEELLALSRRADEIIDEAFADTTVNDTFFEEAKDKFLHILNNNILKKDGYNLIENRNPSFIFKLKKPTIPFMEPRSHVHIKSNSLGLVNIEGNIENSNNINMQKIADNKNDDTNFRFSDANGNNLDEKGNFPSEESSYVSKLHIPKHGNSEKKNIKMTNYMKCLIPDNTNSQNLENETTSVINSSGIAEKNASNAFQKKLIEFSPILNSRDRLPEEGFEKLDRKNENSIFKNVKISKCKDLTYINKQHNGFNRSSEEKMSISFDASKNSFKTSLEMKDPKIIYPDQRSDKTYLIDFESHKELDTSYVLSIVPSMRNILIAEKDEKSKQRRYKCFGKKKAINKIKKSIMGNISTSSEEIITISAKDKIQDAIQPNTSSKLSSSLGNKNSSLSNKEKKSSAESIEAFKEGNSFKVPEKYISNVTNNVPTQTYNLRSLKKLCNISNNVYKKVQKNGKENYDTKIIKDNGQNVCNDVISKNRFKRKISDVFESKVSKKPKLSISLRKKCAETSKLLNEAQFLVSNSLKDRKFPLKACTQEPNIKRFNKGSNFFYEVQNEKMLKVQNKTCPRMLRTESAPTFKSKKSNGNWISSSGIPLKLISNCDSLSLKVKADNKRNLREIRVQKTRERRERLEKEREERIRLGEQKLKSKFQQHEKMLKKKTEKFKIKYPDKQQTASSTSSKESKKYKTKDNEDFCRNVRDVGQKLSKESNSYSDVPLRKVGLASAEGNVGVIPEIATEQNAILVSFEKTPAEILDPDNSGRIKEEEKEDVIQGGVKLKNLKECTTEPLGVTKKCETLECMLSNCSKEKRYIFSKTKRSTKSIKKRSREIFSSCTENETKTPKLMCNDHTKMLLEENGSKTFLINRQNSYLLRSCQKKQPKETSKETCRKVSLIPKSSYNIINPTPQKEMKARNNKMHYKLKCSRKERFNKQVSTHSNEKAFSYSGSFMLTGSQKRFFHAVVHTEADETNEVLSYKIPEIGENGFDEKDLDRKCVPLWATGLYLKQAVIQQYYNPPEVEDIFGILPNKSIDLPSIFGRNRPEYHQRTSSEEWSSTSTPPS